MKNHPKDYWRYKAKQRGTKKDYGTEHKSTILSDDKWVNGIHKSEFHFFFL